MLTNELLDLHHGVVDVHLGSALLNGPANPLFRRIGGKPGSDRGKALAASRALDDPTMARCRPGPGSARP